MDYGLTEKVKAAGLAGKLGPSDIEEIIVKPKLF